MVAAPGSCRDFADAVLADGENSEGDRLHLCTYAQALAAAPDSPRSPEVNGEVVRGRFEARNETTGRGLYCADIFIAHGYVAASRALRATELFSLRVGGVRIDDIEHHPEMVIRLANPDWAHDAAELERVQRLNDDETRQSAELYFGDVPGST